MLYFGRSTVNICVHGMVRKRGSAFIRCARGRSKRCSCIECGTCAYAPVLHAGKSNRKRRNMAQMGKHGIPSTDGAKAAE